MTSNSRFILGSVSFSRIVYAAVWFNMAAAFPEMMREYHYSIQALGYFTTSFLVGAGLFQIPAGLFSARRGATKAALLGLATIVIASAASAYSGEFYYQLAARFLTGVGAAFFFGPALFIISNVMGERKSGLSVGIYSGAFYIGGGLVLLGFTPLAAVFGWRLVFITTAAVTLAALAENAYAFRGVVGEARAEFAKALGALRSRNIWMVSLSILGVSAVNYVVTQFFVSYAEDQLGFSAALAGTISSLTLFGAIIGGPLGGWLSDRVRKRRHLIMLPALGSALPVALFSISGPYAVWAGAFVVGLMLSAAYTNAYAYPTQLQETERRYAPIAIGLINSEGILFGSVMSTAFAELVTLMGYGLGWIILALVSSVFVPLVYVAAEPRGSPIGRRENSSQPIASSTRPTDA